MPPMEISRQEAVFPAAWPQEIAEAPELVNSEWIYHLQDWIHQPAESMRDFQGHYIKHPECAIEVGECYIVSRPRKTMVKQPKPSRVYLCIALPYGLIHDWWSTRWSGAWHNLLLNEYVPLHSLTAAQRVNNALIHEVLVLTQQIATCQSPSLADELRAALVQIQDLQKELVTDVDVKELLQNQLTHWAAAVAQTTGLSPAVVRQLVTFNETTHTKPKRLDRRVRLEEEVS